MIFGGAFSELTDRRAARGKRYALEPLLCSILLAMLAGATSLRKMEAFIAAQLEPLNRLFGTRWKKAPSWVGKRRFLLEIDEAELETACRTHAKRQMPRAIDGLKFIAMDGKALRGSASRMLDIRAKQLVPAFAHDDLIVLGHIEVDEKSNEIPAVQTLIASMGLPGRVFTLDALHCPKNADVRRGMWRSRHGSGQRQSTGLARRMRQSHGSLCGDARARTGGQGPWPDRNAHRPDLYARHRMVARWLVRGSADSAGFARRGTKGEFWHMEDESRNRLLDQHHRFERGDLPGRYSWPLVRRESESPCSGCHAQRRLLPRSSKACHPGPLAVCLPELHALMRRCQHGRRRVSKCTQLRRSRCHGEKNLTALAQTNCHCC